MPAIDPAEIEHLFGQLSVFQIPPLHKWHPHESVDIDLRIAANGQWFYRGSAITRHRLVKLFASILRRELDGRYYLITPSIKYPVTVIDAPFLAVELQRQEENGVQRLIFRTNLDDVVVADRAHPICVEIDDVFGHPLPYIEVRNGLRAKICRSVYYELTQFLEAADPASIPNQTQVLGVYSAAQFFPLGVSD